MAEKQNDGNNNHNNKDTTKSAHKAPQKHPTQSQSMQVEDTRVETSNNTYTLNNNDEKREEKTDPDLIAIQKIFGSRFDPDGVISESVWQCMRDSRVKLKDLVGVDIIAMRQGIEKWKINTDKLDRNFVNMKLINGLHRIGGM